MDQDLPNTIQSGTLLDGKYRIEGYIGAGGMGRVYKAIHVQLGNRVAIKIMHPRFSLDQNSTARFHREAKIISGLHHKNILSVYAFGSSEGSLYMAMEFVDGQSLGDLIRERGPLAPESAVQILLQICEAMTYAHRHKVLHRDLKPDNVLLERDSTLAKVVDFGLAKLTDAEMQRLTSTGMIVGDARYMSPEQSQGKPIDQRSDVYSFGCLMYETLAGRCPFEADTPVAILFKQVSEDPQPFAADSNISRSLQAITLQAMQKEQQQRYQSFEEIATQLQKLVADPNAKVDGSHQKALQKSTRSRRINKTTALIAVPLLCLTAVMVQPLLALFLPRTWDNENTTGNQQSKRSAEMQIANLMRQLVLRGPRDEQFSSLLNEAESIAKQNPDIDLVFKGRLKFMHGRLIESRHLATHAKPNIFRDLQAQDRRNLQEGLNYSRIAVNELRQSMTDAESRRVWKSETASGLKPLLVEEIFFLESLALWREMSILCDSFVEVEAASDQIFQISDKYKIDYSNEASVRAAYVELIEFYRLRDKTAAADSLTKRYLDNLKLQGCDPLFIADEQKRLQAQKQKHHPN